MESNNKDIISSIFNWVSYPMNPVVVFFVLVGDIAFVITYVLVNFEIWTHWSVPYETGFVAIHIISLLMDKRVSHFRDPRENRIHLSPMERSSMHGVRILCLVVDSFAFGRQLNPVWKSGGSSEDYWKLVLVTVVLFATCARCLAMWFIRESNIRMNKAPFSIPVAEGDTDVGARLTMNPKRKRKTRC